MRKKHQQHVLGLLWRQYTTVLEQTQNTPPNPGLEGLDLSFRGDWVSHWEELILSRQVQALRYRPNAPFGCAVSTPPPP